MQHNDFNIIFQRIGAFTNYGLLIAVMQIQI